MLSTEKTLKACFSKISQARPLAWVFSWDTTEIFRKKSYSALLFIRLASTRRWAD
jgi:hypothetical protein